VRADVEGLPPANTCCPSDLMFCAGHGQQPALNIEVKLKEAPTEQHCVPLSVGRHSLLQ
jgi:hypothetical protein